AYSALLEDLCDDPHFLVSSDGVRASEFWGIFNPEAGEFFLSGDLTAETAIWRQDLSSSRGMELVEVFPSPAGLGGDLLSFFHDRLKVYLRDKGARHDLIDAVISPEADDLLLVVSRVAALGIFLDSEDGQNL